MSLFRKEVVEFALDRQTQEAIEEQRAAIAAEPGNSRPYYSLALLYRMHGKQDEALALLLEAVRLEPGLAAAHVALAEVYAVREDMAAAQRHADVAAAQGEPRAREMLERWSK